MRGAYAAAPRVRLGPAVALAAVQRVRWTALVAHGRRDAQSAPAPTAREVVALWAAERVPRQVAEHLRFDVRRGVLRPARPGGAPGAPFERLRAILADRAPRHSVIAFDVFDTLLRRAVDPEWVKVAVARELLDELRRTDVVPGPTWAEVRARRSELERQLALERIARGEDDDSDLASLVERWVATWVAPGARRDALSREVYEAELRAERAVVHAAPGAAELLHWLRDDLGRRLIFVSDFYLPTTAVHGLLEACGLGSVFSAGYVSCELGARKTTGRLYDRVLEAEGIPARELLVIGDDARADVAAPATRGISAVRVADAREQQRRLRATAARWAAERNPFWAAHLVDEAVAAEVGPDDERDPDAHVGRVVAPALVSFALHVLETCARQAIDRVYFVAREGLLLQRLCRMLSRADGFPPLPPFRYLLMSRASTFLPSMHELSIDELHRIRSRYARQSFRELLRSLSLADEPFMALGAQHGIADPDAPLQHAAGAALEALFRDPEARERFEKERDRARSLLRAYLAPLRFFDGSRVALVDIGWNGSMQDNLVRAFGSEPGFPNVQGLYLGCLDCGVGSAAGVAKDGFLADARHGRSEDADFFRNTTVFELAATPDHGTTVGYRPGRREGAAVPVLVPHPAEEDDQALRRGRIQDVVLAYAQAFARLRPALPFTASELRPGVLHALMRYVRYPDRCEARDFLRHSHVEGFGVHEVTTFGVAPRVAELGRNPGGALAGALRRFRTNRWREAAVRRSGVPLANLIYDVWWTVRNHR